MHLEFAHHPRIGRGVVVALVLAGAVYLFFPLLAGALGPRWAAAAAGALTALIAGAVAGVRLVAGERADARLLQSIFVGNLPFKAEPEEVRALFAPYGTVHSVRIMSDRKTGRPRGFCFVEMPRSEAERAIRALDGHKLHGRALRVNEGKQQRQRPAA